MSNPKNYKQVLPFEADRRVKDQFSINPLSIINPTKKSKLKWQDIAYFDDGIAEPERRGNTGWLPNYAFSEFHAGLAQWIVEYWSVYGANIVDPFAGRVTRAVVSAKLDRNYYGYDVSPQTVDRARRHLEKLDLQDKATIYESSGTRLEHTPDNFADLVMTCPPYWNLEEYEEAEDQLSRTSTYDEFMEGIAECGRNINRVLKPGGFVVWVCADFRDTGGAGFINFHGDTINAFKDAGLIQWDTIVMQNQSPFAALQAGKVAAKRYTSKIHEFILVFRSEGEYELPNSYHSIKESKDAELVSFW